MTQPHYWIKLSNEICLKKLDVWLCTTCNSSSRLAPVLKTFFLSMCHFIYLYIVASLVLVTLKHLTRSLKIVDEEIVLWLQICIDIFFLKLWQCFRLSSQSSSGLYRHIAEKKIKPYFHKLYAQGKIFLTFWFFMLNSFPSYLINSLTPNIRTTTYQRLCASTFILRWLNVLCLLGTINSTMYHDHILN